MLRRNLTQRLRKARFGNAKFVRAALLIQVAARRLNASLGRGLERFAHGDYCDATNLFDARAMDFGVLQTSRVG
jgi:hypothetical protein